jgi:hypothetical protein
MIRTSVEIGVVAGICVSVLILAVFVGFLLGGTGTEYISAKVTQNVMEEYRAEYQKRVADRRRAIEERRAEDDAKSVDGPERSRSSDGKDQR